MMSQIGSNYWIDAGIFDLVRDGLYMRLWGGWNVEKVPYSVPKWKRGCSPLTLPIEDVHGVALIMSQDTKCCT